MFKRQTLLKTAGWLTLMAVALLILSDVGLSSCASRSAPSGGPRDTIAPVLDTAYPANQSIHFQSKQIRLVFNEYLNLRSIQQQMRVSPPLTEDPKVEEQGKEILITLTDSLRANTTYIISFGNSITDYTEGNVNESFRYVFSTGAYIDSLALNGRVENAYNGKAMADLMVGLYELTPDLKRDSLLYKRLPNYYALTDENGRFSLTNLRADNYLLVAFEDKGDDFLLNTGQEKMAFWPTQVAVRPDTTLFYTLKSFQPEAKLKLFNARHRSRGRVEVAFSAPADSTQIELYYPKADSLEYFVRWDDSHDTAQFWFRQKIDSLVLQLHSPELGDSLLPIALRNYEADPFQITASAQELRPQDTLKLTTNHPLSAIDEQGVLKLAKDTSAVQLQRSLQDPFSLWLLPPHRQSFGLSIAENTLKNWYDVPHDSTGFSIEVLKGEDLGTLEFSVKTDTVFAYILQLFGPNKNLVKERWFTDSTTVLLKQYLPGEYQAYLIQDVNEDRQYTPGDFTQNRLPEQRVRYEESIELRANWELELGWRLVKDEVKTDPGLSESPASRDTSAGPPAPVSPE